MWSSVIFAALVRPRIFVRGKGRFGDPKKTSIGVEEEPPCCLLKHAFPASLLQAFSSTICLMSKDHLLETEPNGRGVSSAASGLLLELLAPLARTTILKKGQDLFVQGDEADALFVLHRGHMEISTVSEDGRRLAHILLKPGAVFGEMALFDGGVRSATVTAKERCEVWSIDRQELIQETRNNPDLAIEMLQLTIGRLRWMSAQLEDHAFQTVGVRLARRLNFLLLTIGENGVVKISQSDIAEHVGATREAVSKILSGWKERGIVELGRGKIIVLDPALLNDVAATGAC